MLKKSGGCFRLFPSLCENSGTRNWEFPGLKTQTNFFWQGTNNNPDISPDVMNMNPNQYHEYTINWTPDALVYQIDGNTVKEHKAADFPGKFPLTPSRIQLGLWASGTADIGPGTREWGGGMADWQNPDYVAARNKFKSYFKSISVTCGGDTPTADQVSYVYAPGSTRQNPVIALSSDSPLLGAPNSGDSVMNTPEAPAPGPIKRKLRLRRIKSYAKPEFPANSDGTGSGIVGSPGASEGPNSVLNSTQAAGISSPSSTRKKRSSAQQTGIVLKTWPVGSALLALVLECPVLQAKMLHVYQGI
ncbi:hypothetical protein C8J56DRAFT_902686 [Mycena floridula]|nr:hypothetical protein C8J56DRAFT_902686 [Mycena floridula]